MLRTLNSGEEYMKSVSRFIFIVIAFAALATTAHSLTPREQLNQMVQQLQKSPGDNALRAKIIKLARTMKPAPAIPEEAERRMARGVSAMKTAKAISDYKDAAREFELATLAAPWYADAYYNLGMAQNKAEEFAKAAGSLKLYLLAAPGARDAKEARTLMYELEFKQEKADKDNRQRGQAEAVLKDLRQRVGGFTYRRAFCSSAKNKDGIIWTKDTDGTSTGVTPPCNLDDFNGDSWYWNPTANRLVEFVFPEDGTVQVRHKDGYVGGDEVVIFGTPQGSSSP